MAKVYMYTTRFCPYCIRARMLLDDKGVEYKDIAVDNNAPLRAEMTRKSGRHTVPQVFIDDKPIGGYQELSQLDRIGALDDMLDG